jgi:hypothetical protein
MINAEDQPDSVRIIASVGWQRRKAPCPRLPQRFNRVGIAALDLVTTGLDPVVHADFSATWIAGSFDIKTALRAFCPAMTS